MQPAVGIDGLGGFFRQVQIAHEDVRAAYQYFPRRRVKFDLVVAGCRANRARLDAAGRYPGGGAAGFCHAPDFEHGNAQRHVPLHQFRRNRRGTSDAKPCTVNAYEFPRIVQRDPARNCELELQPAADWLARHDLVGDFAAHPNSPGIGALLQRAGFLDCNHHARVELFPNAGYAGEDGRCNLAHVFRNGLGIFNKVEFGAGVHREIFAAHALCNMAQGQKTHALVVLVLRHQRVVAARCKHQALVVVHGAFGLAGGARGVNQNGQVLGPAGIGVPFNRIGMLCEVVAAEFAQVGEADDIGLFQIAQAFHVKHDNLAQAGQLAAHFKGLVELLVVFHKQDTGGRVCTEVMYLRGCIGGIDAVGYATATEYGQVGEHPVDHGV